MTNKAKGVIRLDNKTSFKFTNNTMCELEDILDMDMSEIGEMFQQEQMGWRTVRAIVWAGLLHQYEDEYGNYDLSLKDAGRVMDEHGFAETLEKAMEAFEAFLPNEDEFTQQEPQNREQRRAQDKAEGRLGK